MSKKEYTYHPKKQLPPKLELALIFILSCIIIALIYAILK
jgi:hypothetical protein